MSLLLTCEKNITAFHEKMGLTYSGWGPRTLPSDLYQFRVRFMNEELKEYRTAKSNEDRFDALIDLAYVTLGTAYLSAMFPITQTVRLPWERETVCDPILLYRACWTTMNTELQEQALSLLFWWCVATCWANGWPFREGWELVHAANMRKEPAKGDGSNSKRGSPYDVIKPPGWDPPDLSGLVR